MNLTTADYREIMARSGTPAAEPAPAPTSRPAMNKLETAYARHLELRLRAGEIAWWAFEPLKLRLAGKTHYTPDFAVIENDGTLQFHETKGFMQDDAAVKLKVAAEHFPMRFFLVRKVKGQWNWKRVPGPVDRKEAPHA